MICATHQKKDRGTPKKMGVYGKQGNNQVSRRGLVMGVPYPGRKQKRASPEKKKNSGYSVPAGVTKKKKWGKK